MEQVDERGCAPISLMMTLEAWDGLNAGDDLELWEVKPDHHPFGYVEVAGGDDCSSVRHGEIHRRHPLMTGDAASIRSLVALGTLTLLPWGASPLPVHLRGYATGVHGEGRVFGQPKQPVRDHGGGDSCSEGRQQPVLESFQQYDKKK